MHTSNEENKQNALAPFALKKWDILSSSSTHYMVLGFKGEGGFGSVVRSASLTTTKFVAIKIHKDITDPLIQNEVEMLEAVRALDPEKKNIVGFVEYFIFNNLSCLAFEMLDKSLWDLMVEREHMPLTLNEIRPVTHQLFVAFEALKGIGIVHTDLKPDNIMFVNHKDQPFKVKLIDFGLAHPVSKVYVGMNIQAKEYRAPEVTLGLPLSEAVDMWGVGCIMSFMYFTVDIFSGDCAYHRMKSMVHILGQPENHVLSAGLNTFKYFNREESYNGPRWRLKSPMEYLMATGVTPEVEWEFFDSVSSLEDAVHRFPENSDTLDALEYEDRMAFLSLLKSCLNMDAGCRITPRKALKHPFITMVHLVDEVETSSYADESLKIMTICPFEDFDDSDDSLTDTEMDMEFRDDQASGSFHSDEDINDSDDKDEPEPATSDFYYEVSAPTGLESRPSSSSDGRLNTEISSSTGPSTATDLHDGVRNTTTPTKEESGNAATSNNDNTDTDCVPTASITNAVSAVSAPAGLENESSTSSDGHSDAEISSHENSTGPSAATDLYDGVRDTTTPKEESGDAATSNNDNRDDDCVLIASNTHDDKLSAAAGSTDGVTAAIRSADVDDVKKKKKNVFQKTCKFLSRVKARVVSIFTCRKN